MKKKTRTKTKLGVPWVVKALPVILWKPLRIDAIAALGNSIRLFRATLTNNLLNSLVCGKEGTWNSRKISSSCCLLLATNSARSSPPLENSGRVLLILKSWKL